VDGTALTPQLSSVRYRPPEDDASGGFPYSVPAIATLTSLELTSPVTLLVGENGSGKSTFLEALAIACGLPAVGAARLTDDPGLGAQRGLARRLELVWRGRTHRGFFLRAEDFFGFQKEVARMLGEHAEEMTRIDREMAAHSEYGRTLAKGPHAASIAGLRRRYGADPDARSHGEAFLRLFGSRLVPGGLYLLDEPEAALSPQSQLAFLAMVKDAVDGGSQLVVATHAPILMAIPGAAILSFDEAPVRPVAFEELESVQLVKSFLQAPERYLRRIWQDQE
jgi:predicted ATPase